MATPRADSYSASSGAAVVGGRSSGWWDPVVDSTFFEIPNSSMKSLVTPLLPSGQSYIGADNPAEFANAYACAAISQDGVTGDWAGVGGHTNTSQNGVWRRNYTTMAVTCLQPPTRTDKYPPAFRVAGSNQPGPIAYPSGLNYGRFCLESELTDPLDAGWGADYQAPPARHMYQSAAIDKNGRIQAFYGKHSIFNTTTGLWEKCGTDDFGAKINAAYSNFGSTPMGRNSSTCYDPVLHVFVVSLSPGDEGANWRHGILIVNADTGAIQSYRQGDPYSPCTLTRVGRWVYGFRATDESNGWRYNLDTQVTEWFTVQGDVFANPTSALFEQIPTCYHPTRNTLLRWDYVNNRAAFYEIGLTPIGGAGTTGNRYVLQQTRRAIAGTQPTTVQLNYQMHYHPPSRCVLLEPAAQLNMFAVRMP